jgi:hypothetical protein
VTLTPESRLLLPELLVEPVWSWPLVLLASAALIGVVLLTYPQRVAHLPPFWRRLLIGLRLLTAIVLIFALLRPALRYSDVDKQAAQLIVLTDASRSMTTADAAAGLTRRAALLKTLQEAAPQLKELGDEVELRYFDFAADLAPVEKPADAADGLETSIGNVLDELRREDSGKRVAAILLFSDGAERTLASDAIDPRTAARRFAEQRGVPIHTFTYGSSELTGAGLDYAIEDVVIDPLAYEKKTVPVRFQLRTHGANGQKAKVRLLIERQSGVGTDIKSEMVELPLSAEAKPFEEIDIRGNQTVQTRELTFVAEQAGEFKLAVEVVPAEGEIKQANNRYETVITVLKGGLKVAYFDVARSVEQKFVSRLNENARLQIETFLIPGGKQLPQARIDPALFAPGRFDVYLIGDVPASVFSQGGEDLLAQLFQRCTRDGAGLAMLGGAYSFGAGGYANTEIARLLPVQMSPADRVEIGQDPPASQFVAGPVQMLPGPDGRAHYLMQLGPNSDQLWRNLAPLRSGANKLTPKNAGVNVLAMTAAREPLLLGWDTGANRTLAFGISDTWRWWTHGQSAAHQRFWEQMLLWLAHMENESDAPVWVRVSPRNFAPGDRVTATFGAQDDQKQPIADATYTVEVVAPDGKTTTVPAQKIGAENMADISGVTEPGDYQVLVTARQGQQVYGSPARTRFIVDARDPEMDNPAADPGLMAEIATITGAVPVAPEQTGQFLTDLLKEGLNTEVTRYTQINLWDGWPLLLLFVGMLVTEWVVRKRRGMV